MKRIIATVAFLVALASPAAAHGDLTSSDPEAGSHVQEPPSVVELELAEPPTRESRFFVFDGCDEMLINDIQGDGGRMQLSLDPGQPGRWRVEFRVVSALDGHLVRGDYAFRVAGQRDCSEGEETPRPGSTADDGDVTGPDLRGDEDGGSSPLLPIVALGAGLVLAALVIRKMMAS
jgi:methionine-rich copper-binding protein CopC